MATGKVERAPVGSVKVRKRAKLCANFHSRVYEVVNYQRSRPAEAHGGMLKNFLAIAEAAVTSLWA